MTASAHELEVLLATNLFGLRQKIVRLSWYPVEVELYYAASVPEDVWVEYAWDSNWCNALMSRNNKQDGPSAPVLPGWASGIAQAWEVVEAMAERGWLVRVGRTSRDSYRASFWSFQFPDRCSDDIEHAEAPYAIAKAALIALGVVLA